MFPKAARRLSSKVGAKFSSKEGTRWRRQEPEGVFRSISTRFVSFESLLLYFSPQKVEEMYIEEGTREMYEDQYDSHGVLIKRDDDQEGNFGEARLS